MVYPDSAAVNPTAAELLVLTPRGRRVADRGWPAVVAALGRLDAQLEGSAAGYLPAARELRQAAKRALGDAATDRDSSGGAQGRPGRAVGQPGTSAAKSA